MSVYDLLRMVLELIYPNVSSSIFIFPASTISGCTSSSSPMSISSMSPMISSSSVIIVVLFFLSQGEAELEIIYCDSHKASDRQTAHKGFYILFHKRPQGKIRKSGERKSRSNN